MRVWVALVAAVAVAACNSNNGVVSGGSDGGSASGGGSGGGGNGGSGNDGGSGGGGGTTDGGTGGGGGTTDGGTGGSDGGTDGGTVTITFPNADHWTFYGPQNGGPTDVFDASYDEGGNLWVAGGSEGLFVMKAGTTTFQRFGIADGLHPYGYLNGDVAKAAGVPDGSPADPHPSLTDTPVISVSGGPAGTVYVGYQGKPGCEDAWKWYCDVYQCLKTDPSTGKCVETGDCLQPTPANTWGDPSVYKSGDADKVTLNGAGISVVHYDIFSGPNVVKDEQGGREKLCTVMRIKYDKANNAVWFGGNHGFAMGKADFAGNPTCNGEYPGYKQNTDCTGVYEHVHPAIAGCSGNTDANGNCTSGSTLWLTDAYQGIGVAANGDVWFGGYNRSTVFHYGTYRGMGMSPLGSYFSAEYDTEWIPPAPPGYCSAHNPNGANGVQCGADDRLDIWKDAMPECTPDGTPGGCRVNYIGPNVRNDDAVTSVVPTGGNAWIGSSWHGAVLVDSWGNTLADITQQLPGKSVSGMAGDDDGSIWLGMGWGGGVARYQPNGNAMTIYAANTFGNTLVNSPVANVQKALVGTRKIVVSFHRDGNTSTPGFIGVYDGQ